jgi:hypothetical protein
MKLKIIPARETYKSSREYEVDNWILIINNKLFHFKKKGKIVDEEKRNMEKIKIVRSMYLFLNRNKYHIFSFKDMRYWKSAINKKREMEQELLDRLETKEQFSSQYNEYMILTLKTLNNYDSTYADTIAMTLFRTFPHDISREILAFI